MKFLRGYIPPYKEFREVFFGGGSLTFHLLQHDRNANYRASDLNHDLWCFWSSLRHQPNELIAGIQEIFDRYEKRNGKELFSTLVATRSDDLSILRRGIDFYVLNRITFSGVVDSGGYSEAAFSGRFTQTGIDRLQNLVPLMQKIEISHADYTSLLQLPGEEVVIFLDPPYFSATKSKLYGKKGKLHTGFDHYALQERLRSCPHKWLITYDNSDHIKELYKDHYQLEWQLQYGMTNKMVSSANEILIANYDLEQVKNRHLSLHAGNALPVKAA